MSDSQPETKNELLDSLLGDFLDESDQLLTQLNANMLQLDEWVQALDEDHHHRCDDGLLNEMFRAAHSLKGLSAMLGLTDINHLTHKIENVFDAARHDELSITRDVTERLQRERELQAIADFSLALRAAPTRTEMLPIILAQIVTVLQVENASIEMLDPHTGDAVVELGYGNWQAAVGLRIPRDAGLNSRIHATGKPYLNNDLLSDPMLYRSDLLPDCRSGAGAPMIAHGEMIGFLWIGRKTNIVENEVRLLAAIADIAANAIRRATLYEQTVRGAKELAEAYDATIAGWARAMDLRDQEISGHSRELQR